MQQHRQSDHGRKQNDPAKNKFTNKDKFKGSPEPAASQAIESGEPTLTGSQPQEDPKENQSSDKTSRKQKK